MNLNDLGRLLAAAGVVLALAAVVVLLLDRLGVGRLPGDFSFGSGRVRVFVPLATSLIVSVVATVVLNLFLRR